MKYLLKPKDGTWLEVSHPNGFIIASPAVRSVRGGSFIVDGDDLELIPIEDQSQYVQVHVFGANGTYTYRDPLMDPAKGGYDRLEVGDLVRVPFGAMDTLYVGRVTAIENKGNVPAHVKIKDVLEYLDPVAL